jgi:hypothetical protein
VTYYSAHNLDNGTFYYFRVTAFNDSDQLAYVSDPAPTPEFDQFNPGLYVIGHPFIFQGNPGWHVSVLLIPENILDFGEQSGCSPIGRIDFTDGWETFGAQEQYDQPIATLVSTRNRQSDNPPPYDNGGSPDNVLLATVNAGQSLRSSILDVIYADCRYGDNAPYSLDGNLRYNSNSYAAGLLQAAGLTAPTFAESAPGYGNPLPIPYSASGSPVPSPSAIEESAVPRRNVGSVARPRLTAVTASNRDSARTIPPASAAFERPATVVLRAKRLRATPQRLLPTAVDHLLLGNEGNLRRFG